MKLSGPLHLKLSTFKQSSPRIRELVDVDAAGEARQVDLDSGIELWDVHHFFPQEVEDFKLCRFQAGFVAQVELDPAGSGIRIAADLSGGMYC